MFHLPNSSFMETTQDSVQRTHTILSYSEEQFCLSLLESNDEQLHWNIAALDVLGLDYSNMMFTNSEGLGLFVKTDFALNALYSEIHYRGLKC